MTWRLLRVAAIALLTTVLIGAAISLWPGESSVVFHDALPSDHKWLITIPDTRPDVEVLRVVERRSIGFRDRHLVCEGSGSGVDVWEYKVGWPFYAFVGERWRHYEFKPGIFNFAEAQHRWAISIGAGWQLRVIPLRPVATGIVLNALTFSALYLVIGKVLRTLRGKWRKSRQRCIGCGYDLRGNLSAGCPECG